METIILNPEIVIKGVRIGDKFISANNTKSKRISAVVDFLKTVSIVTGEDTGDFICIAQHELLGQIIRFETPFSTVLRNKVN